MYSNIGRETQAESQGCRSWRFRQKEGQLLGLCTHEAGFLPVNQWAGSWGGIYCWWDTWTNHCTDVGCLWRAKQTTESKRKNAFVSELHLWLALLSFASMKGFWLPPHQCLPHTRTPYVFTDIMIHIWTFNLWMACLWPLSHGATRAGARWGFEGSGCQGLRYLGDSYL